MRVVDEDGKTFREAKVASEPEALATWLGGLGLPLARVGLETGVLAGWLCEEMTELGVPKVISMDVRHTLAAMVAMTHKNDRNETLGLAGWSSRGRAGGEAGMTGVLSPGPSPVSHTGSPFIGTRSCGGPRADHGQKPRAPWVRRQRAQ